MFRTTSLKEFLIRCSRLLSAEILVKIGGIVVIPVYLAVMPPDEYGFYSYIVTMSASFQFMLGFGLHNLIGRYLYSNEFDAEVVKNTSFQILVGSCCLFLLASLMFKDFLLPLFFKQSLSQSELILILLLPILTIWNQLSQRVLLLLEKVKFIQWMKIFSFVATHLVCFGLIWSSSSPTHVSRLSGLLMILFLCIALSLRTQGVTWSSVFGGWNPTCMKELLRQGTPLGLAGFFGYFLTFSDMYVIEKLLSKSDLAVYGLAITVLSVASALQMVVVNVWQPYLFKNPNLRISWKRSHLIAVVMTVLTLLLVGAATVVIDFCAGRYISDVYRETNLVLPYLAFVACARISGGFFVEFYKMFDQNVLNVGVNLIVAALNLYLNFYLVAKMGIEGAALASLIAALLFFALHYLILSYFIHFRKGKGIYSQESDLASHRQD